MGVRLRSDEPIEPHGNVTIHLAKTFSKSPIGRYKSDGPHSGERFREDYLLPRLREFERVTVSLKGTLALGSSFLEEAFGGLVRRGFRFEDLSRRLIIESDDPMDHDLIWRYIQEEDARVHSSE